MSLVNFDTVLPINFANVEYINYNVDQALGPIISSVDMFSGLDYSALSGEQFFEFSADDFWSLFISDGFNGRENLYDPIWGYFTFGQSLHVEYHDTQTYMDVAEFTIQGVFTINATDAVAGSLSADDDTRFTRMVNKYISLETVFENAAKAVAPTDYNDWGTDKDPRCIALPLPLTGANAAIIYALPTEINIEPGQWGKIVRYTATLREAKFPSAKLTITVPGLGDIFLDEGVVNIVCPRPILSRRSLAGCCGEILQVQNYSVMELNIQGSANGVLGDGRGLNDVASSLAGRLSADKIDVGITRMIGSTGATYEKMWPGMSTDEGSGFDVDPALQTVSFDLKLKAGKV